MDYHIMQHPIKITVFMGVFNASAYLVESIESILNQTFKDFEFLIIDDGSTDDSVAQINRFKDSRIRLLQNDGNKGIIATRNRGWKEARGKYICILDSDDIAMPDRLQLQYDYLISHPEVKVLGGHAHVIDGNSNLVLPPITVAFNNDLKERLIFSNVFINSTIAIEKHIIEENGGYQLELAEDYHLFQKIAEKHDVANINHYLSKYRVHNTNISKTKAAGMRVAVKQIAKDIQEKIGIAYDERLLEVHCDLMQENYAGLNIDDCQLFMTKLIECNTHYNESKLRRVILEKWFAVIRAKRTKKAISYFFNPQLFNWHYATFKQCRKMIKQSLFAK